MLEQSWPPAASSGCPAAQFDQPVAVPSLHKNESSCSASEAPIHTGRLSRLLSARSCSTNAFSPAESIEARWAPNSEHPFSASAQLLSVLCTKKHLPDPVSVSPLTSGQLNSGIRLCCGGGGPVRLLHTNWLVPLQAACAQRYLPPLANVCTHCSASVAAPSAHFRNVEFEPLTHAQPSCPATSPRSPNQSCPHGPSIPWSSANWNSTALSYRFSTVARCPPQASQASSAADQDKASSKNVQHTPCLSTAQPGSTACALLVLQTNCLVKTHS
mmetsp:Transcript_14989/g.30093  ORF Transcript_14989/g.30093 Transcript_14989/m.30093 type:complete len:272 (+) Transcript_14989:2126-2941(+)